MSRSENTTFETYTFFFNVIYHFATRYWSNSIKLNFMQFFKLVAICIFKNQNRIFSTPPFREALVFPILLHVVLLLLTRFTIISNMLVLYNLTMPNSSCFFFSNCQPCIAFDPKYFEKNWEFILLCTLFSLSLYQQK